MLHFLKIIKKKVEHPQRLDFFFSFPWTIGTGFKLSCPPLRAPLAWVRVQRKTQTHVRDASGARWNGFPWANDLLTVCNGRWDLSQAQIRLFIWWERSVLGPSRAWSRERSRQRKTSPVPEQRALTWEACLAKAPLSLSLTHTHVHAYAHVCTCMCMCTAHRVTHTHAHAHTHTQVHTYPLIQIHTFFFRVFF